MKKILVIALLFLAGALAVPLFINLAAQARGGEDPLGLKGKAAPAVALQTVDGKDVALSQMRGKVVVLDAWATWCPPCRASLPHLQKLSADQALAAQGLVVWGVNAAESASDVSAFLAANKYTFTVPMDEKGAMLAAYHIEGIPATVIVGRDGHVKATFVGYSESSAQEIDDAVNKALAEK